jgi:hypothetical protein
MLSVTKYFNINNRTVGRYLDKNTSYVVLFLNPSVYRLEPGGNGALFGSRNFSVQI